MTTKEYLQQAFRLNERINSKLAQIGTLNDLATKCTGNMSGMPRNPSPNNYQMEDVVVKIISFEAEINRDIDRLVDLKVEMKHAIDQVDDIDCRLLLELRYLCFKTWEEIAVEMGWRTRHVYEVHAQALNLFKIPASAQ